MRINKKLLRKIIRLSLLGCFICIPMSIPLHVSAAAYAVNDSNGNAIIDLYAAITTGASVGSSGSSNLAFGYGAYATSSSDNGDQLAIGTSAKVTAQDAIAIGGQATAGGIDGINIGGNGTNVGDYSVKLGIDGIGSQTYATTSSVSMGDNQPGTSSAN